jgi:hypothetical protein
MNLAINLCQVLGLRVCGAIPLLFIWLQDKKKSEMGKVVLIHLNSVCDVKLWCLIVHKDKVAFFSSYCVQ